MYNVLDLRLYGHVVKTFSTISEATDFIYSKVNPEDYLIEYESDNQGLKGEVQ